jgi:hypothetical protein
VNDQVSELRQIELDILEDSRFFSELAENNAKKLISMNENL